MHEAIEEEIFYPALKEHPKTKDLASRATKHHVVDMVLAEMLDCRERRDMDGKVHRR